MLSPEESRFVRRVLENGWVPRRTIEEALRELHLLRQQDPRLTLYGYLKLKRVLPLRRIQEAIEHARSVPAAPTPPRPREEPDPGAPGSPGSTEGLVESAVEWLRNTPFWACSVVLHLVLLVLFMGVVYTQETAAELGPPLVLRPRPEPSKPPPPPPQPQLPTSLTPSHFETRIEKDELKYAINKREPSDIEVTPEIPQGTSLESLIDRNVTDQPNNYGISDVIGPGAGVGSGYSERWGKPGVSMGESGRRTEDAVAAAQKWLMRHQNPDGSWSCHDFTDRCLKETGPCKNRPGEPDPAGKGGRGWKEHDIGVTALAMLAFTGSGNTHRAGLRPEFVDVLAKACRYLKSVQIRGTGDPTYDGVFRLKESIPADKAKETEVDEEQAWMYGHAIATLSMAELLIMSSDVISLKRCVENAAMFCIRAQLDGSGWRYSVKSPQPDSSVTGWMVLALKAVKACRMFGLVSQPSDEELDRALRGALAWFDNVTSAESGVTGYRAPGDQGSMLIELSKGGAYPFSKELSCMTAVGVLCRLFAGESRSKEILKRGALVLVSHLPKWQAPRGKVPSTVNFYYWYYGSLAMHQYGGPLWKQWNDAMVEALLSRQRGNNESDGHWCEHGSWDPVDEWGMAGGRVYSTAMGALTLEVYYRYERAKEVKTL